MALIGLPGVGKSSLGAALARPLGYRFVDSDAEIEAAASASVAELVATAGWMRFRELEAAAVAAALAGDGVVLATGGGGVETAAVRAALRARATCVWLTAPLAVLAERVAAAAGRRPLLAGPEGASLCALAARRAPLYAAIADLVFPVDGWSPAAAAAELLRLLVPHPGRA